MGRTAAPATPGGPTQPLPPRTGAEAVRRTLLGIITALIVARPLVQGEDPGLLIPELSDTSTYCLTFLWFLVALGWGVWCFLARRGSWFGSLVEVGLLVVAGLVFLSANRAASYKHPAYLITWEWFALLVVFCSVRQLARTPGDNARLLAALVASGVSLSAYAVYQYEVELPATRENLRQRGVLQETANPQLAPLVQRVQQDNVFATYSHPNSFAGYLALLIPAAFGAVLVSRRTGRPWQTALAGGALLLIAVGLWLTHSRGAILGTLLAGALVFLARVQVPRKAVLLGGAALLLVVLVFVAGKTAGGARGLELARQSFEKRVEYWKATWAMITDPKAPGHFWLGVGPGNFGRWYPRYMDPRASEYVKDPHNWMLELWSTSGIFSLAALFATLSILYWKIRPAWWGAWEDREPEPTEAGGGPPEPKGTRWEFYLGGSCGFLLGFLLSSFLLEQEIAQVMEHGDWGQFLYLNVKILCFMLWFPAFAALERLPWSRRGMCLALSAGLTALLLNLLVSGGISFPSVAQPLWIVAALALNSLPARAPTWSSGHWLGVISPVPWLFLLSILYLVLVFYPVSDASVALREAQNFRFQWDKLDSEWREVLVIPEGDEKKRREAEAERRKITRRNLQLVRRFALPVLHRAEKQDPSNVVPPLGLAFWGGELWKLSLFQGDQVQPALEVRQAAVRWADRATQLDPESTEGYLTLYRLNLLFAHFAERETQRFYSLAADALAKAVKRNPTEARLHYQLAEALFQADRPVEGREQARTAQELDELSTAPTRRLTDPEREQVRKWLAASAGP